MRAITHACCAPSESCRPKSLVVAIHAIKDAANAEWRATTIRGINGRKDCSDCRRQRNRAAHCWLRSPLRRLQRLCEANNGQEAVELAEKLSPDLIILDVSMPVMNGLQAAPVLRKLVPKSSIILYTLYADKAVEQQLRATEVDLVLSKREPISRLMQEAHALLGE
jgi:CheY-like chemotaxis protein